MVEPDNLRYTKLLLNNGSGAILARIWHVDSRPVATKNATKAALEAGFRQLDTSERYRTEKEVGEAMQEVFRDGKIKREDVFIATKLWNNNHRPERASAPSRQVSRNSSSTTSISISSTLRLPSNLETSRTRGMRAAT